MKTLLKAQTLVTILMVILTGCFSKKGKTDAAGQKNEQLLSLVQQAEYLQENYTRGFLLQASTPQDRDAFGKLIEDCKIALLRLADNSEDKGAIEILYRALQEKNKLQLLDQDQEKMSDFFNAVSAVVNDYAGALGLSYDDLYWSLFSYGFSHGLAPFSSVATSGDWARDFALDRSFVKVKGYDNKAWLLSPGFDLTEVKNPKLRIRHLISIDRNSGGKYADEEFDRALILNSAFKAMVSVNYEGDNPEKATWEEVSLAPLPLSFDFHTVNSPEVDLSAFQGKKITIALLYNAPSNTLGHHYVSWQVEKFELLGAGRLGGVVGRESKIFAHTFTQKEFKPFLSLSQLADGPEWEPFAFTPDQYKYAKLFAPRNAAANAWLISPKYTLEGVENPTLKIDEIGLAASAAELKVKISTDFEGDNVDTASWEEVAHLASTQKPSEKWANLANIPIDLSRYQGKSFSIAFQFQGEGAEVARGWEIGSLTFLGQSGTVTAKPYLAKMYVKETKKTTTPPTTKPEGTTGSTSTTTTAAAQPTVEVNFLSPLSLPFAYNFSGGLGDFKQAASKQTAADFYLGKSKDGSLQYLLISGYCNTKGGKCTQNKTGASILFSPVIDLAGQESVGVQVAQKIGFYPKEAKDLNLISIVITEVKKADFNPIKAKWQELKFATVPNGDDSKEGVIESEFLPLGSEWMGKKIVIGFRYDSTAKYAPSWELHRLKVQSLK